MNRVDLDGRVAVVTGAASGLGLATVERFVASGTIVELWDVNEEHLGRIASKFASENITTVAVDVADLKSIERASSALAERRGRIDILVNCAGVVGPIVPCTDYPADEWHRVLAVNLTGVFNCCRSVIPFMKAAGYGRVINVASMSGKEGNPDQIAYVASKAGVIGLTKGLGRELARTGVLVNAIAPGVFETPFALAVQETNPEFIRDLQQKIPLGRMGRVEEFAALAAWLASGECSFSTGVTFDLSGGRATY